MHESNGYPTWWPKDPAAWLSPAGFAAAWVACGDDETVLGHICVIRGVDDPMVASLVGAPTEHLASISRLFTSPAVRGLGLGLGAQLLAAAQKWTRGQGLHLMLDVVDDGAPAVSCTSGSGGDWSTIETLTGRLPRDCVTACGSISLRGAADCPRSPYRPGMPDDVFGD